MGIQTDDRGDFWAGKSVADAGDFCIGCLCVCHTAIRKDDLAQQIERLSSHINLFQKYLKESGRRKLH